MVAVRILPMAATVSGAAPDGCTPDDAPALTLSVHTEWEDFDLLCAEWTDLEDRAAEDNIFLTWVWQHTWWSELGGDRPLRILAFRQEGRLVGIAPTYLEQEEGRTCVRFGGGLEVTDYLGFIVEAGLEQAVGCAFLAYWREWPGLTLDFHFLRPDSATLRTLKTAAETMNLEYVEEEEEVSPRILLPGDWDAYLASLDKDRRHELRRKRRRLQEAGAWTVRETGADDLDRHLSLFFDLHRKSSRAKDDFLVGRVESFFRHIARHLHERGWLALRLMEFAPREPGFPPPGPGASGAPEAEIQPEGRPVAAVLGFVYRGRLLLYNSGYDPAFNRLSAGFVLMSEQVRLSIEQGLQEVDFLRGNERYKYDLGARDVPLHHLRVALA